MSELNYTSGCAWCGKIFHLIWDGKSHPPPLPDGWIRTTEQDVKGETDAHLKWAISYCGENCLSQARAAKTPHNLEAIHRAA